MFIELLPKIEEKIFLEAIDQNFELMNNLKLEIKKSLSSTDKDFKEKNPFEISLENLNVKFCESLEIDENDKEISTDDVSDDSSVNNENNKKILMINDIFNINKKSIENAKQKVIDLYNNNLKLINKIKAIFDDKNNNEKNDNNKQHND
jgi:hypothetical protein